MISSKFKVGESNLCLEFRLVLCLGVIVVKSCDFRESDDLSSSLLTNDVGESGRVINYESFDTLTLFALKLFFTSCTGEFYISSLV